MHQSNSPNNTNITIKPFDLELIDSSNPQQQMLHEKMMMDPVISLVLFNEYIPLKQPKRTSNSSEVEKVTEEMGGLFLGKMAEETPKKEIFDSSGGLFIRSQFSPQLTSLELTSSGGLFIRSEESSGSPQCSSDDWVIA